MQLPDFYLPLKYDGASHFSNWGTSAREVGNKNQREKYWNVSATVQVYHHLWNRIGLQKWS